MPVREVLIYIVLPLWVLAGFADYLCHRSTDIEDANGAKESVLHWLMLGEAGMPVIIAAFFQVNALVIGFAIVCLVLHEITGHIDLRVAMRTRNVTALEQQFHSLLEVLPFTALLLLSIMHWGQAEALFGLGPQAADFSLTFAGWPGWTAVGPPALAVLIFALIPYAEEFVRGLRAERATEHKSEPT
jgi:hypothetical protein